MTGMLEWRIAVTIRHFLLKSKTDMSTDFATDGIPRSIGAGYSDRRSAVARFRWMPKTCAWIGAVSLAVMSTESQGQEQPCARASAKAVASKSPIVLSKSSGFPCVIKIVPRGIEMKTNADRVPEVIQGLVLAPNGRYYSSTRTGQISVWSAYGKFLNNFGRVGKGPGEFSAGNKNMILDQHGQLVVGDNNGRWSVFDVNDKFVRTFPAGSMGTGISGCCVFLDDGTFLTGWINSQEAFRLYDVGQSSSALPTLIRAFGPKQTIAYSSRRIAYAGGKTFWAAPAGGTTDRYVLDEWNTDGTLIRTIRRDVPWVPKEADKTENAAQEPDVYKLNLDASGLLYVHICIKTPAFAKLTVAEKRDGGAPLDKGFNCYFEVIDTKSNTVLASKGPLKTSVVKTETPFGYFSRSSVGFQYLEDETGLQFARIVEVELVRAK